MVNYLSHARHIYALGPKFSILYFHPYSRTLILILILILILRNAAVLIAALVILAWEGVGRRREYTELPSGKEVEVGAAPMLLLS